MAKAVKKTTRTKKVTSGFDTPSILGLVVLLGLLCLLPWASGLNGGVLVRTMQLTMAILLALVGGALLGYQLAKRK